MQITHGLIIDSPWIDYILNGTKIWEMRSKPTSRRGWIALIKKGTKSVCGVTRLDGVGTPLSESQMLSSFEHHRIPAAMIRGGRANDWNVPWYLHDVRKLPQPMPCNQKPGAVVWVKLSIEEARAVSKTLASQKSVDVIAPSAVPAVVPSNLVGSSELAAAIGSTMPRGESEISEGNLRHNHIYLRRLMHLFPADAIGGSNKRYIASHLLTLEAGGMEPIQTDIDGSKAIFRARGWIGAFFRQHMVGTGDVVYVSELGPYHYRLDVTRRTR